MEKRNENIRFHNELIKNSIEAQTHECVSRDHISFRSAIWHVRDYVSSVNGKNKPQIKQIQRRVVDLYSHIFI